ncbi:hypothetical protein HYR99_23010 [Candidatus Poribacteria bacterium]|nr:hypothetical protein [Candidatus Poribacteria bacterium]
MSTPSPASRNPELIAGTSFPGNWIELGPKGTWGLNETGGILQKSVVGTRKPGSGVILVQKDSIAFPIQELKLVCRPGSQHQVGVVFSLVDDNNFCTFCIDQHSKRYLGYDLVVFEVKEGEYNLISKECYKTTRPEAVTFTLRQMGPNLLLCFNDALAYTWTDMPIFGKKVGLYSYKNDDAVFLSMGLTLLPEVAAATEAKSPETGPKKESEVVVREPEITRAPMPVDSRDGITRFLGIKQPASKTEIEFTEVFTVPLDSFYSSLYQNTSLDNSVKLGQGGVAEVQLLDLRIKRWYRELKAVREELAFANGDLDRKKARVIEAEAKLKEAVGLKDEEYAELEKTLAARRTEYRAASNRVHRLRDTEGALLREIRTNGYVVEKQTSIDAIKALGYDFHIIGQAVARGEYDPMEFEERLDLSNDELWKAAEEKLYHQLFDSGAITEKGASLYRREREQLGNFGACPSLVEASEQLRREIERYEELRPLYENSVRDIELEIGEWENDKQTLRQQRETYPRYVNFYNIPGIPLPQNPFYDRAVDYSSTKELSDKTVGWFYSISSGGAANVPYPPHPNFQATWLNSGQGGRRKLNKFVADVYIDSRPGWEAILRQALALYYPEIGVSFYHRFEATYDQRQGTLWGTSYLYYEMRARDTFGTNQNILDFFNAAIQVCDHFIGRKWNDPAINLTASIETKIHYPDDDPLAEFLASISGRGTEGSNPVETYFFAPTPDGFYNQNGLSLREFMKTRSAGSTGRDIICVFPVFDPEGRISGEMVKAVRNPQRSEKLPSLPTIKFVESYRIEVGWKGYGLGELNHSFNLFPGETKELVVEKSTKLSTKVSETRKTEEAASTHLTSSFEDNLQNEFSVGEKAAQESSSAYKRDSSQSGSSEDTSTSEDTTTHEADIKASAEAGVSLEVVKLSSSIQGGYKYGTSSKKGTASKRNSAWSASQSAEEKRASNQSKEILSKNVSNAVRKVASETSQSNKLEFSAVSSREYEESTTNREVIKLQNPNVGKTVNYNFFQIQNLFGVTVKLIDVQVVIDSGVEMVKGAGVNDVRVHDLEEFGKIYANSDQTERAAALAAIVARQVIKHYGDFLPGVTSGNGAIGVRDGLSVDRGMIEILHFSSEESGAALKERIERIKTALEYLKGVSFRFRETSFSEETTVAVNAAAYHVEAQLGFLPATEAYLEERREIETDKQRALVKHLRAQTEAKVFYPELPEGITTLNVDGFAKLQDHPKSKDDQSGVGEKANDRSARVRE